MGDSSEESKRKTSTGMENLSLETNRFSRDLLQRFMGSGSRQNEFKGVKRKEEEEEEEEEGDVELSLGLSLGGRFGVDRSSNKLMRSSSIASCLPVVRDDDALAPPPATVYPTLVRTSSLPVETEEEWRKRKELQTLRRMEAKRRRSEKQRNLRAEKESGGGGSGSGGGGGGSSGGSGGGPGGEEEKREVEVNWRGRLELLAAKRFVSSVSLPCGLSSLTTASRQASLGRGIDLPIGKGKASYAGGNSGGLVQPLSQGSMESQGGSSSSVPELKSRALQGCSSGSDLSHASIQSLQERDAGSSGTKTSRTSAADKDSASKRTDVSGNQGKEIGMNAGEDMPCVFTKGDGPNGRRVDGILYKYGKGEEVRIMCVCHGSFLTPAEFVKHAGGSDVAHPLKHIVINPNPPSF